MYRALLLALTITQCLGLDLVGTLVSDPDSSTLVQLVTKAGLGAALSSANFTIFAPTDAAFSKVPQATLDSLNADTTALADLLQYHVIPGNVMKSDVSNEQKVTTLNGNQLRINIYTHNNVVTVEGVPVATFDEVASNGVIHKLTGVMTPPSGNIPEIVAADNNFSILLGAIQHLGLADTLKADHLTVFAPTDAAFQRLSTLHQILSDDRVLREVLTYHVVDHTLYSAGLYDRELPHSADSHHDRLLVHVRDSGVTINNAHVTQADLSATNGVVHVIDHVLIPIRVQIWLRTGILG